MPEIRQVRQIVRKIALKRYGIALAQQFEQMAGRADGRDRQEPDAQDPSRFAAAVAESGDVELTAEGLPPLRSAAPAEFGGPGNRWSPETLLAAAVGDCFILTFRAVARMSRIQWTSIRCNVVGTLERRDRAIRFTKFEIHACLTVPAGTDAGRARRALDNAEHSCLIANSLNAPVDLVADIAVDGDPDGEPVQACHREHTTHASAAHLKAQPSTLKRLCN